MKSNSWLIERSDCKADLRSAVYELFKKHSENNNWLNDDELIEVYVQEIKRFSNNDNLESYLKQDS